MFLYMYSLSIYFFLLNKFVSIVEYENCFLSALQGILLYSTSVLWYYSVPLYDSVLTRCQPFTSYSDFLCA